MAQAADADDPYAHLPSEDIDVEHPTSERYRGIMNWMNGQDLQRAAGQLFREVPITSTDPGYRRINLIHSGKPTVSLIIDETNLYLVAFRRGDGRWLHFRDLSLPKIPGDNGQGVQGIPIQLASTYMDLIDDDERPYFSVGRHSLNNTHHVLLRYDDRATLGSRLMNKQRKALTQLIVMFCEAARFTPIFDFVCQTMDNDWSEVLDVDTWKWIKNWSTLSAFALHCRDVEEMGEELDPAEVQRVASYGIQTAADIAALLRVILRK